MREAALGIGFSVPVSAILGHMEWALICACLSIGLAVLSLRDEPKP